MHLLESSTRLRCFGMTSRERYSPDKPRILLKCNSYEWCKKVVQFWSTIIGNIQWRSLLPNESQPVQRFMKCFTVSYTMKADNECSIKNMKKYVSIQLIFNVRVGPALFNLNVRGFWCQPLPVIFSCTKTVHCHCQSMRLDVANW